MADRDRIRAAAERAIEAMQEARLRPGEILVQTAPLHFPSRPAAPTPEYLQPDYVPRERARLMAMAECVGLADEVREMLMMGESNA
ncbi:hypothetical protein ABZT49_12265 [Methylobacterium sp. EM32]|uniref:hypothetical protein n=1 Tax=Methylobacterium sp. EM32 TaxID=3163481 RepID=UPI0033AE3B34